MRKIWMIPGLVLLLASAGAAQGDGFRREGDEASRVKKDALEGKPPPALQVTSWQNTNDTALKLSDLTGKVVVLDFWGVW